MEILIAIAIVAFTGVSISSVKIMHYASHRPANGEVRQLLALDRKIEGQMEKLNRQFNSKHHNIKPSC
jgi:hypothetical protein